MFFNSASERFFFYNAGIETGHGAISEAGEETAEYHENPTTTEEEINNGC